MGILKPREEEVTLWVEVPGFIGFQVEVRYLTPADIKKIREAATRKVVNRQRAVEEEVDNDKMARIMVETMIQNWRGLTVDHLKNMMPVSEESVAAIQEAGGELPFSKEELKVLTEYTYSRSFMDDITEMCTDMGIWRDAEDKVRGN